MSRDRATCDMLILLYIQSPCLDSPYAGCLTLMVVRCYYPSMNTPTSTAIYRKLSQLEQELQRLKIQTYRALPRESGMSSAYAEKAIQQAVKQTRDSIWHKRYAKKVARIH